MFLFVPGLSAAVKCSIIGGACVAVAAAEVLRASTVLESIKTKAGLAFVFKRRGAAAEPSEPLSSSQVAPEADNGTFINVLEDQGAVRSSTLHSSAINVKMQALDKLSDEVVVDGDPAAVKVLALHRLSDEVVVDGDPAAVRLSDEVVVDGDPAAVKMLAPDRLSDKAVVGGDPAAVKMQAPDRLSDKVVVDGDPAAVKMLAPDRLSDEVVVDGDPAAVKMLAPDRLSDEAVVGGDPAAVKMLPPDRLSDKAVVDGDPAATYDGSIREQVSVVGGRRHDPGQHLDSTADVVASVGTACGKLPLMPDLGAESADVKAKAVHLTAIRDHHLDPTVERNGRSWASGVFKGTRDFVRGCIKNAIPWISRVFKETCDLVKEWILDHQVMLKKILLVVADVVVETSPIWKHSPSCKQLLMRVYRLVRSEVRW